MNFFKRHPIFTTLIAVFALVIVGEAWFAHLLQGEVTAAEEQVRQRIEEIERLQRQKPAPVDENLRIARDDLAQNAEVLSTMLRVLNVTGPDELEFFQGEPTTRADGWFEISQFVDRMTKEAKKTNVALKADERFGFSAYANLGPEPAYLRSVYRQHRIVEYLLGKLFAARPQSLIAVQREEPLAVTPVEGAAPPKPATPTPRPGAGGSTNNPGAASEIFAIDPQVSARTEGYVGTMAFRIVFSGQTTALRGFLNALAAPEIPLVVRSVEVSEGATATHGSGPTRASEPPSPANPFAAASPSAATPPVNPAAVPIVAENVSVFTVTVELFDVKIRAPQTPTATASHP